MEYVNDKIVKEFYKNGFEVDVWYDTKWMAVVSYQRYPELNFHVYPDEKNIDYSLISELLYGIDSAKDSDIMDAVLQNIANHFDKNDFTSTTAVCIQHELQDALLKLKRSLNKLKQWMDGETKARKISYSLLLNIFVNNELCNFSDLKESERERIKTEIHRWIHRWLEGCESIDSCYNEFVNKE